MEKRELIVKGKAKSMYSTDDPAYRHAFSGRYVGLRREEDRAARAQGAREQHLQRVHHADARVGAGIQNGDVIVQWDGKPIAGIDDLHRLLSADYLGRSVDVVVIRRAQRVVARLTPTELPAP